MQKSVEILKSHLKSNNLKGIALDIDETLSWTIGWWVERMQKFFGNPENLTVVEMVEKYKLTQNVPYWQTKEALEWMEIHREDNELQKDLPLIHSADNSVKEINKIIPILAYITVRPESVITGTKEWLRKHGFPEAEIIARPKIIAHNDGNRWKADVLEYLSPEIAGIIDDNPGVIENLNSNYKGKIFLFNNSITNHQENVITCPNWQSVIKSIKSYFNK